MVRLVCPATEGDCARDMVPWLHSGIEVMAEQSNRRQNSHEGFAEVLEGGQPQQGVGVKLGQAKRKGGHHRLEELRHRGY